MQQVAERANSDDSWWYAPVTSVPTTAPTANPTVHQYYNVHTPILGWPGSTADAMSAFVSAGDVTGVIDA